MEVKAIEFTVDGLTLRGNLYKADKPKELALLFIHGWTGLTNEDAAAKMAQSGSSCMTFSLSGHNNSDGQLQIQTRQRSLKEVIAAYDFFKDKLSQDSQIGVVGNSYGTYMGALLSVERPIKCLSLRVPTNYPDEGFNDIQIGQDHENPRISQWRLGGVSPKNSKSLKAIADFKGAVQIIEAENDEFLPHQVAQSYVDAVANADKLDYHFMKGWPHSLGTDPERNQQFQQILLDWVNSQQNDIV